MTSKYLGLGLLALSLAACQSTEQAATSVGNTVVAGATSAGNAVGSAASSVGNAVSSAVSPAPAPAPVAHGKTAKKGSKGKHVKTAASREAGDGAYMGGGMVVTTPVGTGVGTGDNTRVGTTIPVAPGTPMTAPSAATAR